MSTLSEDLDDLIGDLTPEERVELRRKAREETKRREFAERIARGKINTADADPEQDLGAVKNGVTATWIAQALQMTAVTVRQKLAKCPSTKRGSFVVYSLKEAIPYLVKPALQIDMKKVKITDLPNGLQESYWRAKKLRQEWEREAGHLWHTADVLDVFSAAFQAIKFATQLWLDDMERETAITPQQLKFLVMKVDELQQKVYEELVKIPTSRATLPTTKDHVDEAEPESDNLDPDLEEDLANLI